MILQVILLIISIAMLYFGANFALEAAEKIGLSFGLSPLVIGLLIVGFGTSLPEFFVSHIAIMDGTPEIAFGNIIGSNVANLFLILAISGIMAPLYILRKEIRIQFILHLILTLIVFYLLMLPRLAPWGGGVLAVFFSFFIFDTFKQMLKQRQLSDEKNMSEAEKVHLKDYLFLLIGFILLYFGGDVLVGSGSKIAEFLGVSSYIISAIFIALGTSFPELITSIMACLKKKNTDIITGNIIGSNIFNIAFILGSISIYNIEITHDFKIEMIVLTVASIFLLALNLFKKNFGRISGIVFLSFYLFSIFNWTK